MRLTMRTSLAMKTLMLCAATPDRILRRQEIATACKASENHLAQVIHSLGQMGYLRTIRGRAGGLTLGRPAQEITVGQVFADFERVLPFSDCIGAGGQPATDGPCPLAGTCRLTCLLNAALDDFYARLNAVTLADLVAGNDSLAALLEVA